MNICKNAVDEIIGNKDGKCIISVEKYDKYYNILIQDNGGGIREDIIDKIFEPYFSTKSKNGTGLGLHMSKVIVETQLNGQLSASNKDDGALFTISLPIDGVSML